MSYNEDSRVKIPAILHLERLGYKYLSLKDENIKNQIDDETNIFKGIFFESVKKINEKEVDDNELKRLFDKISMSLENEDLWKEFYEMLLSNNIKIIDFENFENNNFHVVTELTCKNGEDEFRPDITILINGLPLAFIEVKKPNNREWILAERKRINTRFANKKFRKFINITQLLVFSNNMEYDDSSSDQLEWAFYSSTSYKKAIFNKFKEDKEVEKLDLDKILLPENDELENFVLKDNNLNIIKYAPEFITNKNLNTPTNRILTSLFYKERLKFLLKYSLVYVKTKTKDGGTELQKHIMRYPQIFATKAIENKIESWTKKWIIWHTQWSGKTALSFYNVRYLTDYFQKKNIIPKFYFIVDRIDLLTQAKREFIARWLKVHTVNSKEELLKDFQSKSAIFNDEWKLEITVVNIHKFKEDDKILNENSYNLNIQRIYFLDEVHRSYDPNGSFLANLFSSDREAIIIGLTWTPLISKDKKSKDIFWDYIHKYYYNSSIADGYTLKLIREEIETSYKIKLQEVVKEIQVLKWDISKKELYAHKKFVDPMLEYIMSDFSRSKVMFWDDSIWAMVVCDSSEQAKMMKEIFDKKYNKEFKSALILHDIWTKDERKEWVEDFKEWKIDILFVYNMLLTWFDAPRLKKLYLGRVIKAHNLLQTLTRVNRPYKDFKYGYVVDFADIKKEFDITNKAYFEELQDELWDEMESYSNIFLSKEEIEEQIETIKDKLFSFDLENKEIFSKQISEIKDKKEILDIKKTLISAKNLYNIIRLAGHYEIIDKLDFKTLTILLREVENHLSLLNLKDSLENKTDSTNLLNLALEDVVFKFTKVGEEELVLADKLKNTLKKTREAMWNNFDHKDPEFIKLYDELKRLFEKKNLEEVSQEEMTENIEALNRIYESITDLNRRNNLLKAKYMWDEKFVRLHKRYKERDPQARERMIFETFKEIKEKADETILNNSRIVENEWYFTKFMAPIVINSFQEHKIKLDLIWAKEVNTQVAEEYLQQFTN